MNDMQRLNQDWQNHSNVMASYPGNRFGGFDLVQQAQQDRQKRNLEEQQIRNRMLEAQANQRREYERYAQNQFSRQQQIEDDNRRFGQQKQLLGALIGDGGLAGMFQPFANPQPMGMSAQPEQSKGLRFLDSSGSPLGGIASAYKRARSPLAGLMG
jgi:hypothetical protein